MKKGYQCKNYLAQTPVPSSRSKGKADKN